MLMDKYFPDTLLLSGAMSEYKQIHFFFLLLSSYLQNPDMCLVEEVDLVHQSLNLQTNDSSREAVVTDGHKNQ